MASLTTTVSGLQNVLRPSDAAHLLQKVQAEGNRICLTAKNSIGSAATGGRLIDYGKHALAIRFDDSLFPKEGFQAGSPAYLTFVCDQIGYKIESHCLEVVTTGQTKTTHLHWPADVFREDRRRHLRRKLQTQTHVTLESEAGGWSAPAVILNVSPIGMACRAKDDIASHCTRGQSLRAHFQLANDTSGFQLIARVINVTQAGSSEHSVVGLEFTDDAVQAKAMRRLREILASRNADTE